MMFLGKMWLVIIFEVTKNRVNLSLQNTCSEKPQEGQTDPLPAVLGLSNSKTNSRKGLLLEVTKYFFYNLVTWKSLWCRIITNVITCLFLKSLLYQTLFDILIFETRNFSFEVIFRCWGCFTYDFLWTSNSNYYKGVWNSNFLHQEKLTKPLAITWFLNLNISCTGFSNKGKCDLP